MVRFSVDVHENGVVLATIGLGSGSSKVFEKDRIEDALLEMYRMCSDWEVGDKIKIERKSSEQQLQLDSLRSPVNPMLTRSFPKQENTIKGVIK